MLSLSSAKAGSSPASGKSEAERAARLLLGVVWEARSEVRDGGRSGVVGREGTRGRELEGVRWGWCPDEGGLVAGVVIAAVVAMYIARSTRA